MVAVLSVTIVAVAVVVARSTGVEDDSIPRTGPPESTVVDQATTTVTTVPPAPQVVASDDSGSRYTIATSPFTVQLTFTGLCWVEVRRGGSDGEALLSGTFESGNSPTFTESSIWIRLGYPPAATVTVNGVALPPISGTNDPFNLEIAAGSPPG